MRCRTNRKAYNAKKNVFLLRRQNRNVLINFIIQKDIPEKWDTGR